MIPQVNVLFILHMFALYLRTIFEHLSHFVSIHIKKIEVLPTAVVANPDTPPELEIRFDMEPWVPKSDELLTDMDAPLPINWCLRFIHNQLFKHFVFPSRFCPGPFHSTILRKADWRSPEVRFLFLLDEKSKSHYFILCFSSSLNTYIYEYIYIMYVYLYF